MEEWGKGMKGIKERKRGMKDGNGKEMIFR
jgi:hypothetical protein